jgi:hypothetical protein
MGTKYNQNDQVKEDEMGVVCSTYGERKNAYNVLVGRPGSFGGNI